MKNTIKKIQVIIKTLTFLLVLLCIVSCQGRQEESRATKENVVESEKPNVLFIVIDDLKPLLGCYDDPYAISPNIDKLATNGTVFRRNYCQQAICGPSRANLLTGLRPDHTRVWDLATRMRDENPNIMTIPQYFKNKGYTTTGIGKIFDDRCVDGYSDKPSWSIPFFKKSNEYYAEGSVPNMKYQDPQTLKNMDIYKKEALGKGLTGVEVSRYVATLSTPTTESLDLPDHAYIDGANTNHAIDIIKDLNGKTEPFFMAVGIAKPHLPFTAPKKYWDMYGRDELPLAEFRENSEYTPMIAYHKAGEIRRYKDINPIATLSDKKGGLSIPLSKQKELIHGYYAAVSYADELVGKLMATLDSLRIRDNTIVVLVGDHGWHLGDHNLWCKHSNFENAVQTPLIISTPGLKANENYAMTEFVDIFPTLCDLAKIETPDSLDGVSLVPLMSDSTAKVKDFAVSQYPRGKNIMGYSLRTEQYRYTVWAGDEYKSTQAFNDDFLVATELYDYKNDPLEKINVVDSPEYASIVKKLHQSMTIFMADQ